MRIEPLTLGTLEQAKALLNRVFPSQFWWERSDIALPVSLYKDAADRPVRRWLSRLVLRLAGIADVNYWVAIEHDTVVGICGYYFRRGDPPDTGWGGWSCVAPECRHGLTRVGGALIRTVARAAAQKGKKFVRMYTVSDDQSMMNFLTRRGFKSIPRAGHFPAREKVLYLEADLRNLTGERPSEPENRS